MANLITSDAFKTPISCPIPNEPSPALIAILAEMDALDAE